MCILRIDKKSCFVREKKIPEKEIAITFSVPSSLSNKTLRRFEGEIKQKRRGREERKEKGGNQNKWKNSITILITRRRRIGYRSSKTITERDN